jgi:hypothetical protein
MVKEFKNGKTKSKKQNLKELTKMVKEHLVLFSEKMKKILKNTKVVFFSRSLMVRESCMKKMELQINTKVTLLRGNVMEKDTFSVKLNNGRRPFSKMIYLLNG